jgi:hypothetical protein
MTSFRKPILWTRSTKLDQRRAGRIELEGQNEERRKNPAFDFGNNTVPIGLAAGDSRAAARSRKVN